MKKKRKIDYIIEQSADERLVFRFYPRRSSCHSFGDEPPQNWSDVYKVYYCYAIIRQWKFDTNNQWESEIMFCETCDECSEIQEVGQRCLLLASGVENFKKEDGSAIPLLNNLILPLGMGTNWTISNIKHTYYSFTLFDCFNKGFRFSINEKDVKAFGEYLLGCCEYMLTHGDPI